jgi:hypothetical protein
MQPVAAIGGDAHSCFLRLHRRRVLCPVGRPIRRRLGRVGWSGWSASGVTFVTVRGHRYHSVGSDGCDLCHSGRL